MKTLAWYTLIVVAFVELYLLGAIIEGEDVTSNLFVAAFWIPPIVFSIKYLRENYKK